MRLKSVGPMLFFEAVEDTQLGDIHVPAGTAITLLTRQPGLDEARFPEPERFDPDRWADPTLTARLQKTGVFTPFGSGPRLCPGRELALLEMRLVLPMLAHSFDLTRHGSAAEVHEVNGFTVSPNAVMATLRAR
jgi:cytochrome P450